MFYWRIYGTKTFIGPETARKSLYGPRVAGYTAHGSKVETQLSDSVAQAAE